MVVGGVLLLSIFGFQASTTESAAQLNLNLMAQANSSPVGDILEADLRTAGYGVSDSIKVTRPDSNSITFKTDINDNGVVDSVRYYVSTGVSGLYKNTNVRTLYRRVNNGNPLVISDGVSGFTLLYYDASGSLTNIAKNIRSLKVCLEMQNTFGVNNEFAGTYWERVIKPKNLR